MKGLLFTLLFSVCLFALLQACPKANKDIDKPICGFDPAVIPRKREVFGNLCELEASNEIKGTGFIPVDNILCEILDSPMFPELQ